MQIRHASLADAAAITDIYNHAVVHSTASFDLEPKSVEDRQRWLSQRLPQHPVLVATEGDTVLGWAALSRFSERPAYDRTVEISVYIHDQHQQRGVGRSLTSALLDEARIAGIHSILARICTENTGSIAMVRSLGFAEAGTVREVGWKFDRWLDVVTWEYLVPDEPDVS